MKKVFLAAIAILTMVACKNEPKQQAQDAEELKAQTEKMVNELVNQKVDSIKKAEEALKEKEKAIDEEKEAVEQARRKAERIAAEHSSNIYMFFVGKIGGDENAEINLNGKTGTYTFLDMTRNVTVDSYNENTGDLVISGYERKTGKYIGRFVGKVRTLSNGWHGYRGKFTNYKGVSLPFDLNSIED